MNSRLEEILSSVSVDQWQVQSTIIIAWYDGPREGLCVLAHPACAFYFRIIGEWYNPEGLDDRLFQVSDFPEITATQSEELNACGSQALGQYSDDFTPEREQTINTIIERRGPPILIVRTADWMSFEAIWSVIPSGAIY